MEVGVLNENGLVWINRIVFVHFIKTFFVPTNPVFYGFQKIRNHVFVSRSQYAGVRLMIKKFLLGSMEELKADGRIGLDLDLIEFGIKIDFGLWPLVMQPVQVQLLLDGVNKFPINSFI